MALTADQKEEIMAARGESAAAPAKSVTRRYNIQFADGKSATMLDMEGEAPDELIRSVTGMFRAGYVLSIAQA